MYSDHDVKGYLLSSITLTDVRWHCIVESHSVCPQPSAKCCVNMAPNQLGTS